MTTNQQDVMTETSTSSYGERTQELVSLLEDLETDMLLVNHAYKSTMEKRTAVLALQKRTLFSKLWHTCHKSHQSLDTLKIYAGYFSADHGRCRANLCESACAFHNNINGKSWTKKEISDCEWRRHLPHTVATETQLGKILVDDNPDWTPKDCENKVHDISSRLNRIASNSFVSRLPAGDNEEWEEANIHAYVHVPDLRIPKSTRQKYEADINTNGSLAVPLNGTDVKGWNVENKVVGSA